MKLAINQRRQTQEDKDSEKKKRSEEYRRFTERVSDGCRRSLLLCFALPEICGAAASSMLLCWAL